MDSMQKPERLAVTERPTLRRLNKKSLCSRWLDPISHFTSARTPQHDAPASQQLESSQVNQSSTSWQTPQAPSLKLVSASL